MLLSTKNHWSGAQNVDRMVTQGEQNNLIVKHEQTDMLYTIDPMWYDWQAINANSLLGLQGLGVFLLLNVVAAKIGLMVVARNLK